MLRSKSSPKGGPDEGLNETRENMQTATATATHPATPSPVVVAPQAVDGVTGTLAFWRLSGEVGVDQLTAAVEAENLAFPLPRAPSTTRALKRALDRVACGSKQMVERHPKGGYAIVHKGETEEHDLDYRQGLRAWWEQGETADEGHLAFDDETHPLCDAVRGAFAHYRVTFTSEDISLWLPKLVASLFAVALRTGGGFYLIPAPSVAAWDAWCRVFRQHTEHKLYNGIPALSSEGMLEAALDSIIEEVKTTIERQQRDIGDVGKRALKTKENALEALAEKLTIYEGILGRKLPELHKQTEAAKGKVSAALLIEDED